MPRKRHPVVFTIAAQKGGVSKTTTAAAIAQALSYRKKKVLLIDGDAQGSATLIYGASNTTGGTYNLITGKSLATDLIQETEAGFIIPGSPLLDRLDIELNNTPGRDSLLRAAIAPLRPMFDYIIIDTAPGLGTTLVQALTAADRVIIPLLCDPQALQGLHQVTETISQVKKYCNPDLEISGVVITQYQPRAVLTRQYEDLIADHCSQMGIKLAKTRIRRGIAIQEAQALRKNLYAYNPKSNPASDYMKLCSELGMIN